MPARLPESVSKTVIDMYSNQRLGAVAISRSLGIGSTTVLRILRRARIERKRSTRKEGRPGLHRFGDELCREIADKYAAGFSREALEKEYQCSGDPIRRAVIKNGGIMRQKDNPIDVFTPEQLPEVRRLAAEGKSQEYIGSVFSKSRSVVNTAMALQGIKVTRNVARGSAHGSWKGGRTVSWQGYVGVHVQANSEFASMRNVGGYVPEHRLVMAQSLGRPLSLSETVHHINGNHGDNRLENLQLRQGRHGKHVSLCCADCGSRNVIPIPLAPHP